MRVHAVMLVTIVAGTLYPLSARADMYVWIDKAGVTNVSNLSPPDGVRIVSVTRAVPKDPAQDAALREAAREAELRALNDRVQQLQAEVEQVRRDPPPTIVVPQPQPSPPPPAPYVVVVSAPAAPAWQPGAGCDYAWGNCGFGVWPGFYPASIVVVRDRHFRHHRPGHHAQPWHFGGFNAPPQGRWPPPVGMLGPWGK